MPDSSIGSWYVGATNYDAGFGNFEIEATTDSVFLWACIYSNLLDSGQGVPGYTIVLPGNPYGL